MHGNGTIGLTQLPSGVARLEDGRNPVLGVPRLANGALHVNTPAPWNADEQSPEGDLEEQEEGADGETEVLRTREAGLEDWALATRRMWRRERGLQMRTLLAWNVASLVDATIPEARDELVGTRVGRARCLS